MFYCGVHKAGDRPNTGALDSGTLRLETTKPTITYCGET